MSRSAPWCRASSPSWTCRPTTPRGRPSTLGSAAGGPSTACGGCSSGRARSSRCAWSSRTSTGWMPRPRASSTRWSRASDGATAPPRQLPAGVQPRLGEQDLLQPAPARPPAARERGRTAPRAARGGRGPRAAQAPAGGANGGGPLLPRGERADARRDRRAGRRARRLSTGAALRNHPGAGHGAGHPRGPDRPPPSGGQDPAPDGGRHRQGRAVRAAAGHRQDPGGGAPPGPRTPPGRRVPVRDRPLPRAGVHIQARAHPGGGLRRPAPGAATRPPRRDRPGLRDAVSGARGRAVELAHLHAFRGEVWDRAVAYLRAASCRTWTDS